MNSLNGTEQCMHPCPQTDNTKYRGPQLWNITMYVFVKYNVFNKEYIFPLLWQSSTDEIMKYYIKTYCQKEPLTSIQAAMFFTLHLKIKRYCYIIAAVKWLALLPHIQEVPGLETGYSVQGVLWFSSIPPAKARVKVKEPRNRPSVAQRVPGGLGSQILWHSAHEGGEVVSLTHRPPLPLGNVPGTHFH